ncbi:MAG: hypothetical protein LBC28_04030 [Oscillospiraceae bacterium]|jgi:hypothetical protein|nr:hypothetical protein [Oscillospiraceae bacterium]
MSDFQETLNKLLSDPEQMGRLAELAKTFAQGQPVQSDPPTAEEGLDALPSGAPSAGASLFSALDPKTLGFIGRLVGEYGAKSDKEALLRASTPYVKEPRRGKIEQAARLAKLARLARMALTELSGAEGHGGGSI